MKRLFIFALLCECALWGATFEASLGIGKMFVDHDGRDEYWRPQLTLGYQFNSLSDQLLLTLYSDKKVDEAQFGYAFVLPSLRPYTPFDSVPFIKASVGLGNTYAETNALTHLSYGVGIGAYTPLSQMIRLRYEINYAERHWQIDRKGNEPDITPDSWKETEFGFFVGLGVIF